MKYRQLPKSVDLRVGCKVSWHYYATEEEAKRAAEIAKHNAIIDAGRGYDFGYCMPGEIRPPRPDVIHPDLWEVCVS
jgi:hypothetical protein